ncbi:hypothetical protein C8R46DRAFT_1044493 [Mycena filopes]|nr:hypothetical protein C8R46DRAFT_1044493 [Mycena filopes]
MSSAVQHKRISRPFRWQDDARGSKSFKVRSVIIKNMTDASKPVVPRKPASMLPSPRPHLASPASHPHSITSAHNSRHLKRRPPTQLKSTGLRVDDLACCMFASCPPPSSPFQVLFKKNILRHAPPTSLKLVRPPSKREHPPSLLSNISRPLPTSALSQYLRAQTRAALIAPLDLPKLPSTCRRLAHIQTVPIDTGISSHSIILIAKGVRSSPYMFVNILWCFK